LASGLYGTYFAVAFSVTIITTGGTIEKVYDESVGTLENTRSIVRSLIIERFRLPDLVICYEPLFCKDSLEFTDDDRSRILETVRRHQPSSDAIMVTHGTDTMAQTGEMLHADLADLNIPVVLTGAMRPLEIRESDAVQNVAEALLACRLVDPGVYVVMHNRVLRFPGVVKDREHLTFTHTDGGSQSPQS